MKTICFFGNSHLGALNQALPDHPLSGLCDPVFWGVAGTNFPKLVYRDGKVISSHPAYSRMVSGGRFTDLDVAACDAIVFYACHIVPSGLARRIAMSLDKMPGLSRAVREATIDAELDLWWQNLAISSILEGVSRDFPQIDRLLYLSPLISSESGFYDMAGDHALIRHVLTRMDAFVAEKTAVLGVHYRRQPAETINQGIYTPAEFGRGSVKLASAGKKHPETDYNHMNAAYGRILLDDIQLALSLVPAVQEI